jgi:hypothetical protein
MVEPNDFRTASTTMSAEQLTVELDVIALRLVFPEQTIKQHCATQILEAFPDSSSLL